MASNPPGKCCTVGKLHEGEAKGEIKKIGDFRAYFSYPENKSTENAIIFITDVFGIDLINPQLIADQFAANGYFVVMPDLFNGDVPKIEELAAGFDLPKWLANHGTETVDPIIAATIKELKGSLGAKHIGAVGYCFGAKYVIRFLKKGQIEVGYVAHPSFVTAEELQAIEGPLSIAAAETDSIFPAPKRRETEDILEKKDVPYQITLYSDVEHGFAVRGDLSKKPVKFAKEQAFCQAVQFFDEYLKA